MGKLIRLELFSTLAMNRHYPPASLTSPRLTPPAIDFKSYKGHHTLLFGDSYFTSIIGPNGSGKSNSYVAGHALSLDSRVTPPHLFREVFANRSCF